MEWGRYDTVARMGTCPHCGAFCQLNAYTTRNFVGFFGLPLFPLSRRRIVDRCERCLRFRSLKLKSEPTIESIRQHYRPELLDRGNFPDPGELGWAYAYFGKDDDAERLLRQAGDSPQVKARLGFVLLRKGRLAEGAICIERIQDKELIWFLYVLLEAYQQEGRMADAERLLDRMSETWPELADDERFQEYEDRVQQPSAFLQKPVPLKPSGPLARLVALAGPPLLLSGMVAAYVAYAGYLGRAHPLFLVNGLHEAAEVEVQGQTYQLPAQAAKFIEVREGKVSWRRGEEKGEITLRTPFWSRPLDTKVYVLNPDRTAAIMKDEAFYNSQATPGPPDFVAGEELYILPEVDYPFRDFPEKIPVSRFAFWTVAKSRYSVLAEPAEQLVKALPPEQQAAYLQAYLSRGEATPALLELARIRLAPEQLLALTRDHLDRHPVETSWHETYQDVMREYDPGHDLVREYRERLSESATDPELQYLLGRLLPGKEGRQLIARSTSPFARTARAKEALARGDFATAAGLAGPGELRAEALWGSKRYDEASRETNQDAVKMLLREASGRQSEAEAMATDPELLAILHYARGQAAELRDLVHNQALVALLDGDYPRAAEQAADSNWWLQLLIYAAGTSDGPKVSDLPPAMATLWEHPDVRATRELVAPLDDKRVFLAAMARRDPKHKAQYLALLRQLNFDTRFPYLTLKRVTDNSSK